MAYILVSFQALNPRNRQSNRPFLDPLAQKYRRNDFIKAENVRLIDSEGEPVGIVTLVKALEMAREAEMDLVEVAPNASPPVCKIISWSKFKYEQSKKTKGSTSKTQMKEVRFGAMIGEFDRGHKTKRIKEFLTDKYMVRIMVRTPGRVKVDQSKLVMNKVIEDIFEYGELDSPVKFEGRSVVAIVKPLKVKRQKPIVESDEPVAVI